MRRLCWQMMVTLDGFVEEPSCELGRHVVDEDFQRDVEKTPHSVDAILLGRVTREMFASCWPSAANPEAAG